MPLLKSSSESETTWTDRLHAAEFEGEAGPEHYCATCEEFVRFPRVEEGESFCGPCFWLEVEQGRAA